MKSLLILVVLIVFAEAILKQPITYDGSIKPTLLRARLPSNDSRIIGGKESVAHSRPYQVALYVEIYGYLYFCAGSLISSKFVLTAAHCLEGVTSVIALLGATDIDTAEASHVYSYSRKFGIHKNFDPNTIINDIGYVELSSAVKFNDNIQPVMLPKLSDSENAYTYKSAIVSGWGVAADDSYYLVSNLREVEVVVIPNADCYFRYNTLLNFDVVHDSTVCTSGSGGVGACSGDSGGPLVVGDTQIGIASFALVGFCERTYPTGFTRITSHLTWIAENTDVKIAA